MTGRVLLTGGTGFLGRHVRAALSESGWSVTLAGRKALDGWDFVKADGQAERAGCAAVESGQFAVVVHLAALARTGEAQAKPDLAMRLNAAWPRELARAAGSAGISFVHASTDLVFGGRAAGPAGFGVEDEVAPIGRYGESKAAGEAAVLAHHPGALVLRFPLLFGDSGGAGLGASDGLFAALDRGERPGLFTDELRTPLDVEAAARSLALLVGAGAKGIWHLGGRAVSRFELGLGLCLATGRDPKLLVPCTRASQGVEASRAADVRLDSTCTVASFPGVGELLKSGSAPPFPKS